MGEYLNINKGDWYLDGVTISLLNLDDIIITKKFRIGEVLEYLLENPDTAFQHLVDEYKYTISYNKEDEQYIFNAYEDNREIIDFCLMDLMTKDFRWEVKENYLSAQTAFEVALEEDLKIKHRDMYSPMEWQEFFWEHTRDEVKEMIKDKAWEVF